MIPLNTLKNAIIRKLRDGLTVEQVARVYGENAKKIDFPCVHVQLEPSISQVRAAGAHIDRSILVDIRYMEETVGSNEAIYDMLDAIGIVMMNGLAVEDRKLSTLDATQRIEDGVGHYLLNLEFTDTAPETGEEYETMETIEFDKEVI